MDKVLGIRNHGYPAPVTVIMQPLEGRQCAHNLHTVVGGICVPAGHRLLPFATVQDSSPTAGTGVAKACTIRMDDDLLRSKLIRILKLRAAIRAFGCDVAIRKRFDLCKEAVKDSSAETANGFISFRNSSYTVLFALFPLEREHYIDKDRSRRITGCCSRVWACILRSCILFIAHYRHIRAVRIIFGRLNALRSISFRINYGI